MSGQRNSMVLACLSLIFVLVIGCARSDDGRSNERAASTAGEKPLVAKAILQPRSGGRVSGVVTFTQEGKTVSIVAHVEGTEPGVHGFHVHEQGDCNSADFGSAGDHFNPRGGPHGGPADSSRHAGDLGNIDIGPDGSGHLALTTDILTVAVGPNSVVGRAVILHEKADDFRSQPGGNAGERVACGVVELEAAAVAY